MKSRTFLPQMGGVVSTRQSSVAALFGTVLENYDFVLFTHLLPCMAAAFFPKDDPFWLQEASYWLFALGFFFRPIGGVLFGHFSDRLGRGKGMIVSMVLMALPTLTLALLPGYERIGICAVFIVCFCRILQSFSSGAEFPQASTVMVENAPSAGKAFASSLNQVSLFIGALLGAVSAWFFTQSSMPSWGWRISFFLGSIIAVFGLYMRRRIADTPDFEAARKAAKLVSFPFWETLKKDWRSHMVYILTSAGFGALYSNVIAYAPSVARSKFGFSTPSVLLVTMFVMGCCLAFLPIFGILADKVGVRKVMSVGSLLSAIMASFAFRAAEQLDFRSFLTFQTLALVAFAAQAAPSHALTKYMYPTERRCSGVAFAGGVGGAIFSGASPIMLHKLQALFGFWGQAAFVISAQVLAIVGICFAPSFKGQIAKGYQDRVTDL